MANLGQGLALVPLGVALAVRSHQQTVMAIDGRGKPQERLKQPLGMDGLEQVLAANDMIHALQGVIDYHRQMIGEPDILAGQDDVAGPVGPSEKGAGFPLWSAARLEKGKAAEVTQAFPGGLDGQSPGEGFARQKPGRLLGGRQRRAEERLLMGMGRRLGLGRHFPARSKAAIEDAVRLQALEGLFMVLAMAGLTTHRLFPGHAQPGEIFEDGGLELGLATGGVYVFDAEQKPPSALLRRPIGHQG